MIRVPQKLLAIILMKRLWEEKPMRLIASELGISEGKARRYFHRGMFQMLKKYNLHQQPASESKPDESNLSRPVKF